MLASMCCVWLAPMLASMCCVACSNASWVYNCTRTLRQSATSANVPTPNTSNAKHSKTTAQIDLGSFASFLSLSLSLMFFVLRQTPVRSGQQAFVMPF